MTKRLNFWLAIVLILIGLPAWWLLMDNRPGDARPHDVHIGDLRRQADAMPGAHPAAVEYEEVASRTEPGDLFAAGLGLRRRSIAVCAFRLPVPGKPPVMIDSGIDRTGARAMGFRAYDQAAQSRIDGALRQAGLIVLTHEHADHIGGLLTLAGEPGGRALLDRTYLPRAQLPPSPIAARLDWPKGPLPVPSPAGDAMHAIAPGVVVIPAPSHSPGSQMIYVHLATGGEYLFTGDIATLAANWEELRARSRLVGQIFGGGDRAQVYAWLMTIRQLKTEAPNLIVIPGHDLMALRRLERDRAVSHAFAPIRT